ncbi:MAG: hypothetical protein NTX52_13015, partial [Planctomycetota bacterium]|nr:hypothetical protein [Planctomycetota bacterium]
RPWQSHNNQLEIINNQSKGLPCLPREAQPFRAKWGACRRENALCHSELARLWRGEAEESIEIW